MTDQPQTYTCHNCGDDIKATLGSDIYEIERKLREEDTLVLCSDCEEKDIGTPTYEFFWHSNKIENVEDKEAVLKNMEALEYLLDQEDILTHEAVKKAHQIIMEDRQPEIAGEYKQQNNFINKGMDGKKVFCPPEMVRHKMEELLEFQPETEEEAWEWKMIFVNIHPFLDGNGRMSRLLYYAICERLGEEPRIVRYGERHEYYDECDELDKLRIDTGAETKEWNLDDLR